jgi:nitrate reductase NapAB chaperone NapD
MADGVTFKDVVEKLVPVVQQASKDAKTELEAMKSGEDMTLDGVLNVQLSFTMLSSASGVASSVGKEFGETAKAIANKI